MSETPATTVVLDVRGTAYSVELLGLVQIGEDTINQNISEQPGLYAFYAFAAADCKARREAAAQALKDTKASIELKQRKLAEDNGIKTTEAKIAALVELDPEVVKRKEAFLILEGNVGKLEAVVRAFDHRKEMLITLGANMRTDVEKGVMPSIRRR